MKLEFWKNLPTWLKGGIIGALVALIGLFLPNLIPSIGINFRDQNLIIATIYLIIFMPFQAISLFLIISGTFGCRFKFDPCTTEAIVGQILTVILLFGIGAYLEWMKSKKKLKEGIAMVILTIIIVITSWMLLQGVIN
ncbi:hypothetical protein KKD70_01560 [Patescibacteria group bacterium]|nr:hypothetical protein [Patescibacteria group bacterium]